MDLQNFGTSDPRAIQLLSMGMNVAKLAARAARDPSTVWTQKLDGYKKIPLNQQRISECALAKENWKFSIKLMCRFKKVSFIFQWRL